jgi:hypothetical protein
MTDDSVHHLTHEVIVQLVASPPGWQAVFPRPLAADTDVDTLDVYDLAWFEPIICLALVESWEETRDKDDPLSDDEVIPIPGYWASTRRLRPVVRQDYELTPAPFEDSGQESPIMLLAPGTDPEARWIRKQLADWQRGYRDNGDGSVTLRIGGGKPGHFWMGPVDWNEIQQEPDGSLRVHINDEDTT